jgi:hypothetical protein
MAIDKSQLDLFYEISTQWTARDQRYQAIIGFEYELCHASFEQLHKLATNEMNADATTWAANPECAALGAIMSRAFVDHAAGVQKMIRGYSQSGWLGELARSFYEANHNLFALRNALQHSYERIDADPGAAELQPLCGDLSWSELTDRPSMDLYLISYGPMVGGQFASPSISMQAFTRFGLNHIYIRAHEAQVNAIETFNNVTALVQKVHDRLSAQLNEVLTQAGIRRGSPEDIRLPSQPSGRLRVDGIQVTPKDAGVLSVTA